MHKLNFYFIKDFDPNHIKNLPKDIAVIYRNYDEKYDETKILKIKKFCQLNRRKFFLANNIGLVTKLNLDGAYIPSFNKSLSVRKLKLKNFILLGSAHNIKKLIKKRCKKLIIYLSHQFLRQQQKNKYLGLIKFNILSNLFNNNIVALGGINKKNFNIIKNKKNYSFASISYIKNNTII